MDHQPVIFATINPDMIKAILIVLAIFVVMAIAEARHD